MERVFFCYISQLLYLFFVSFSTNKTLDFQASQRSSSFPMKVRIDTCFINICQFFGINLTYFLDKFSSFFINFDLFFKVIFSFCRTKYIAAVQQLNSLAISFRYASGCFSTYPFNFSGSIFLNFRYRGFFSKWPYVFYCFSHRFIVVVPTLKMRLASF